MTQLTPSNEMLPPEDTSLAAALEQSQKENAARHLRHKPLVWIGTSFADRQSAEHAYQMLRDRGYEAKEITLAMSQETRQRHFATESEETEFAHKAQAGTVADTAKGALSGALIGSLLALGSNIVAPGVGLFLGGPLFIGLGALTGGLNKALTEAGIPEQQAAIYETDVQEGRMILGVTPHNHEDAEFLAKQWK